MKNEHIVALLFAILIGMGAFGGATIALLSDIRHNTENIKINVGDMNHDTNNINDALQKNNIEVKSSYVEPRRN